MVVGTQQAVCSVCTNLQPSPSPFGAFRLVTTRAAMRATAEAGCPACTMVLACTSYWSAAFKDTDEVRFGDGLVVHGDRLGSGVRIHTLLGKTPAATAPWETVKAAGIPLEHPTLDDYVAIIQDMFRTCAVEHKACNQATAAIGTTPFQPTRLLDISSDRVRLIEPCSALSGSIAKYAGKPYIALSHCWGRDPVPAKTVRANMADRQQGIPWEVLTQTFQDVVTLARRLDVLLVWIDSLCIVQDDELDWAHEASQMAAVYQHAYLTVAATAASNGGVGLFRSQRQHVYKYEGRVEERDFTVYARPVLDHTPFRRPNLGSGRGGSLPLLTRGWCFQEQLLCTRVVHFTAEELVWDCFSGTLCECAQNDGYDMKKQLGMAIGATSTGVERKKKESEQSEDKKSKERKELHDQLSRAWCDSVEQYTYRTLTFVEDRLPALSGLASFFEQLATGSREAIGSSGGGTSTSVLGTYMAGLWEKDLPFCLLWVSKYGAGQRPRQKPAAGEGTADKSIPISLPPTWSWASVDQKVISFQRWSPPTAAGTTGRTETIRTVTFPSTSDPRGMVAGGRLTLRGPLARLCLQQFLIRSPGQGSGSDYSYMQYILSYDTEGSVFQGMKEPVDGESGGQASEVLSQEALSQEVQSPKTVGALQPDVPLNPLLATVWFLNLAATSTPATETTPERRRYVSGVFLQRTTRTAAFEVSSTAFPLFERVGVGALMNCDDFDKHSMTETVTIE